MAVAGTLASGQRELELELDMDTGALASSPTAPAQGHGGA